MPSAAEERALPNRPVASSATAAAVYADTTSTTITPDYTPRIALIGNPNTGKTTLFNRLCGARAKTANFPGTTTAARVGRMVLGRAVELVDLPGLYALSLDAPESRVCRSVLLGEGLYRTPDA